MGAQCAPRGGRGRLQQLGRPPPSDALAPCRRRLGTVPPRYPGRRALQVRDHRRQRRHRAQGRSHGAPRPGGPGHGVRRG
ncbi:hypothetical protein G6F63_015993 [Rhizopus arrhizus]|nr:hypothetical protein G6F63_015993 [Rhizopus arrhizus]